MNVLASVDPTALSLVFSSNIYREFGKYGISPTFANLYSYNFPKSTIKKNQTIGNIFDSVYNYMLNQPDRIEYLYKSAIVHNVLLGKHSLNTACMINEFRAGNRKADIVIMNGNPTAYEIKSEKDNLTRLSKQIESYRLVFSTVNIISAEKHIDTILEMIPRDVGIFTLTKTSSIKTIRQPKNNPSRTVPAMVFESLQILEAKLLLSSLGINLPDCPNTEIRSILRDEFIKLSATSVQKALPEVMRKTRSHLRLKEYLNKIPNSLKPLALSIKMTIKERANTISAMNLPANSIMSWR
ncbi:MAG: sce7726 family protein [Sumerlaeia bacterium]